MCKAPSPSFSRSLFTWVSTVRVSTSGEYPHTRSRSASRDWTRPARLARSRSNRNSSAVRRTSSPWTSTRCAGTSMTRSPLYSQHELPRTERLGHVVVSAHLEANHAIDLIASGSQHDHEAPTHFEARNIRQHHVEHHQVRLAPLDLGQGSVAVVGNGDVVTRAAQVERNQFGQVRLVLYD